MGPDLCLAPRELYRHYAQTSKDDLEGAGVNKIKHYLIYLIQGLPKCRRGEELRQSMVFGFYRTLQMVYHVETKRQLQKATNGMVNNVGAHRFG